MNSRALIASLLALAAFVVEPVAAEEPVLKESQLTKQGLIERLTPRAAAVATPAPDAADAQAADGAAPAASSSMHARGFHPKMRTAAANRARASILITFVTDSAELTPSAKTALNVLASAMKAEQLAAVHFTIEGYADPRGSEEHNQLLSQQRADSVRSYLISTQGLTADRVVAIGKGANDLLVPGDPAAPENRRVTIVAEP